MIVSSSSSAPSSHSWLYTALKHAGIDYDLTLEQRERVLHFFQLRTEWNQVHNLTGPKATLLKSTDFVDSIAVSLCMDSSTPLVDIGTGSGVPGLLVGCLLPSHPIYLVEPSAKRCAFLKTALFQLELDQISVYRTRWPCDQFNHLSSIQPISRAVVSPDEWPHLALKRVSKIKSSRKIKKSQSKLEDHSSQPHLPHILQMLAFQRPTWPIETYTCTQELHYLDPEGGQRCVKRWSLSEDTLKRK